MSPEQEEACIDVDLKEIELIFAQSHVRMTIVASLTNVSVGLSGFLAAGLATLVGTGKSVPIDWFLVIPLPFFVFAFLVLREDLLMTAHHRYIYQVRKRLLAKLGRTEADPMLRSLSDMKAVKVGGLSTVLSGLRYSPLIFVVAPSLAWFAYNATWLFTVRGFGDAVLLIVNVTLFVLLVTGMRGVGRDHIAIEKLAPLVHGMDG